MMEAKVAVLLPVYKKDNPDFFIKSINSVLNQTYQDFIILVGVDGPVKGNLADVLYSYKDYVNIHIEYFPQNRGLACVLNDLIAIANEYQCSFFARIDADDICEPRRFQRQLDFMVQHPDVDVVGGKIEEINKEGNTNGKSVRYPLKHEDCRLFFRYRDPLAHPATFFRKRYFEKTKGYRPEYRKNQDTMLWFDGFMNGCIFANLPETVLYFRVAPDFYSRRNGWKRAKQMLSSRLKINKALKYDVSANLFAIAMALMTVSPTWLKKCLYSIR